MMQWPWLWNWKFIHPIIFTVLAIATPFILCFINRLPGLELKLVNLDTDHKALDRKARKLLFQHPSVWMICLIPTVAYVITDRHYTFTLPGGWIMLLSAYVFVYLYRLQYRKVYLQLLQSESRCLKCGYNLTGNESGVCPECGVEIKP